MSKIITIKNLQRFLSNLKSNYFDNIDSRLNTLNDKIKDKIENAEDGADWNAQEGEAGYIENRPCCVNLNNGHRITLDNADITLSSDENWYEKIIIPIGEYTISLYYYDPYGELVHYVLTEGQSVIDYNFGCSFTAVLNEYDSCDLVLTDFADSKEFVDNTFAEIKLVYEYNADVVKQLNLIYLPNTVIKTTPQTLTDNDKNQVLANLGLTDIARKEDIANLIDGAPETLDTLKEIAEFIDNGSGTAVEQINNLNNITATLQTNIQTHNSKLNTIEAKIGSENWSGVYIIKINSKTIDADTSYAQITTIFNDLKALLANNRYPSVILIDEGVDIPNMNVVESISETESTITCIQIRPQVGSGSFLLMGYSFGSNGKMTVNSSSISSGVRALDPIDLGNSITNPTVDGEGVDITTHYSALLSAANAVYNNMGRASFSIKFNYRVMTCIGVKTKDSNNILVAWFTDVDSAAHYLITLNKTSGTATLSAKSI